MVEYGWLQYLQIVLASLDSKLLFLWRNLKWISKERREINATLQELQMFGLDSISKDLF